MYGRKPVERKENAMELKDYVRETLLAIVGGVMSAQDDERCGAFIGRAPSSGHEHLVVARDAEANVVSLVKFDLATTNEDKSAQGGRAGIKVVPFLDVGGRLENQTAASLVNRISFVVPVAMPQPTDQRSAEAERRRERDASAQRTEGGPHDWMAA